MKQTLIEMFRPAAIAAVVGFGLVVATSVVYAFLGILNFLLN